MKNNLFFFIFCVFCFCCCKKEEQSPKIIVQAYLYPDQPINIKLSQLSYELLSEVPVGDALVMIINNNKVYTLSDIAGKPGCYSYYGNELTIKENEKYELSITYKGINLYAETTVPPKPENLNINQDTIVISILSSNSFRLNWEKKTSFCFISIEHMGEENLNTEIPNSSQYNNYIPYYLSTPYSYETVLIGYYVFQYYGTHKIKVHSINEEYRKLYEYKEKYKYDSPPVETNITNGLGIFTGIAYDSILVEVKSPEE